MQAAAAFGLLYHCSPFAALDRPAEDLPAVLALIDIADSRLRAAKEAT